MITAVWGTTLSSTVAALIVARPHLGHRLALAQRRVVHGLSAYIHHATEQGLDPHAIAAAVDGRDIWDLLGEAIPHFHPRLYGMFDRLGDKTMPLALYRQMNDILSGPASNLLLANETVTVPLLGIVEAVAADPVLLAAQKAIGKCSSSLHVVQSILAFVRATGLAIDVERLPPGSSWRALQRRVTADLGRATAPPLVFRNPVGWKHVEEMSELLRIGNALENCVANFNGGGHDHLLNFIAGTEVFFITEAEPLTLAAVRSVGPGLWRITEMAGSARLSGTLPQFKELRGPLPDAATEIGHTLLETEPGPALQHLAWRTERTAGDLGEDEGVDEVDEAA